MKRNPKMTTARMNQPLGNQSSLPDTHGFFHDVFEVVRLIPEGRVTTYGAIAAYLGTRMSARMVGWAMNASHQVYPPVPAQRVVNRNGMLTGRLHFETPSTMQELLEKEGINVRDNKVESFPDLFWDPRIEITL